MSTACEACKHPGRVQDPEAVIATGLLFLVKSKCSSTQLLQSKENCLDTFNLSFIELKVTNLQAKRLDLTRKSSSGNLYLIYVPDIIKGCARFTKSCNCQCHGVHSSMLIMVFSSWLIQRHGLSRLSLLSDHRYAERQALSSHCFDHALLLSVSARKLDSPRKQNCLKHVYSIFLLLTSLSLRGECEGFQKLKGSDRNATLAEVFVLDMWIFRLLVQLVGHLNIYNECKNSFFLRLIEKRCACATLQKAIWG